MKANITTDGKAITMQIANTEEGKSEIEALVKQDWKVVSESYMEDDKTFTILQFFVEPYHITKEMYSQLADICKDECSELNYGIDGTYEKGWRKYEIYEELNGIDFQLIFEPYADIEEYGDGCNEEKIRYYNNIGFSWISFTLGSDIPTDFNEKSFAEWLF